MLCIDHILKHQFYLMQVHVLAEKQLNNILLLYRNHKEFLHLFHTLNLKHNLLYQILLQQLYDKVQKL